MPQNIDPNAIVNVPCPQCGQKTQQTVAMLETSPRLRCPACGAQFAVNARKVMEKLKQAQARIELDRRRSGV